MLKNINSLYYFSFENISSKLTLDGANNLYKLKKYNRKSTEVLV